jgi:hypothetical protein
MKTLLLAALLGAGLAPTALRIHPGSHVHSHLLIEAGKQFILGGGQPGSFTVVGQNNGPVAVEVLERPLGGPTLWRARLEPGQRARLKFGPGITALVRNTSARQAVLDVDVFNGQGLTMTYESAPRK